MQHIRTHTYFVALLDMSVALLLVSSDRVWEHRLLHAESAPALVLVSLTVEGEPLLRHDHKKSSGVRELLHSPAYRLVDCHGIAMKL